jgi:hypothetical protein
VNAYSRIAASVLAVALGFQVVQAATVSTPSTPKAQAESLSALLEREVAAPLRERHLGWDSFSRAGPRWDASHLQVIVDAAPGADGWTAFRLEAPKFHPLGAVEVVWRGRVNPRTRAIELTAARGNGAMRALADVLAEHRLR